MLIASMSIAFVGVLESLISGKIADALTKTTMKQRQECFAVAAANLASGMAGGIPATACIGKNRIKYSFWCDFSISRNFLTALVLLSLLLYYYLYLDTFR